MIELKIGELINDDYNPVNTYEVVFNLYVDTYWEERRYPGGFDDTVSLLKIFDTYFSINNTDAEEDFNKIQETMMALGNEEYSIFTSIIPFDPDDGYYGTLLDIEVYWWDEIGRKHLVEVVGLKTAHE